MDLLIVIGCVLFLLILWAMLRGSRNRSRSVGGGTDWFWVFSSGDDCHHHDHDCGSDSDL